MDRLTTILLTFTLHATSTPLISYYLNPIEATAIVD